jgi:hypothetical protein
MAINLGYLIPLKKIKVKRKLSSSSISISAIAGEGWGVRSTLTCITPSNWLFGNPSILSGRRIFSL